MVKEVANIPVRRTGGILAAVTAVIVVAFAAAMLLLFNQNVDYAVMYTENNTDLLAHEVVEKASAVVDEQSALVRSDLTESDLLEALSDEAAAMDAGGALSEEDFARMSQKLGILLHGLVVDDSASEAFFVSLQSGRVYFSEGADRLGGQPNAVSTWVQSLRSDQDSTISTTAPVTSVVSGGGPRRFVLSGRALTHGGKVVAMMGVCMDTYVLSQAMETCFTEQGQQALLFYETGAVLLGTGSSNVSNVFSDYPVTQALRSQLSRDATQRWRVWEGLDGIAPREQRLFDICYDEDFNAYLLCTSEGAAIFGEMRERSTTLLLVLGVVAALLVLLAIAGVRWYRMHLMKVTATDELTGLANRRSFAESYERVFAQQDAGVASFALVDADYFKQINDAHGHAVGDEVLSTIAAELRSAVGSDGLAGRWGGDEFVAVFRVPLDEARVRANRMIRKIASLEFADGAKASISIGMTELDARQSLERMVEQADEALYVTKEGGRGFLSVYDPDNESNEAQDGAAKTSRPADLLAPEVDFSEHEDAQVVRDPARYDESNEEPSSAPEPSGKRALLNLVMKSMLDAVRWMIPFVAGGGILVAVAFLFDAASVDMGSLSEEARSSFGSITPIAAGLHDVGLAAFNFMLPIFGAFFARGLAGNKAFVAGFAGGFLSSQGSAGFIGAIATAIIAAVVVRLLDGFFRGAPDFLRRVVSVVVIPVFSLLVMYLFMIAVVEPIATVFDTALTGMLVSLADGNRMVLGAVLGAMMSTDMGGFINKAAYHFGTASISVGSPDIMAAVMVGGMVAPCGIALSMILFRTRFTDDEYDLAPTTLLLGLSFITEGAIPFAIADFARVIPSCMAGSALSGALSMAFGCTLMAPHGGIFVFPVVGNPALYLVALAAGSLLTALVLGLLKRLAVGRLSKRESETKADTT